MANSQWYHLENLLPDIQSIDADNIEGKSPLANTNYAAGLVRTSSIHFEEKAFLGHLVLRVDGADKNFQKGIKNCLGVELPTTALTSQQSDTATLCWVSPNEWLIMVAGDQTFAIESALREQLTGHYALVNVSGGQTLLSISGDNVINLLKKSGGYDFSGTDFVIDKVITTNIASAQALIRRVATNQFDLVIRRSFADYLFSWLDDAASEYL